MDATLRVAPSGLRTKPLQSAQEQACKPSYGPKNAGAADLLVCYMTLASCLAQLCIWPPLVV